MVFEFGCSEQIEEVVSCIPRSAIDNLLCTYARMRRCRCARRPVELRKEGRGDFRGRRRCAAATHLDEARCPAMAGNCLTDNNTRQPAKLRTPVRFQSRRQFY